MSDERQVMALLAEGNPATEIAEDASTGVPAATYLATLEQRSSDMTQLETKKNEQESKRLWTTPWRVAAIAVIVLGVATIMVNQAGVPAIPLAGAEGDLEASRGVQGGRGGLPRIQHRRSGVGGREGQGKCRGDECRRARPERGGPPGSSRSRRPDRRFRMLSRGYGDWSEVTDPGVPTPTGYYFICEATETNSLWDMAGIQIATTYHWVVDNGAVVAVMNQEDDAEAVAFREAFDIWMKETHPEIDVDTLTRNPEGAPTVLEYAEEFVAQSDQYPIEGAA